MTAVALVQTPRLQFILADGSPNAGGTVATYVPPSVTTPVTTYQDPAGTIPNPNPLTLDAIGSCSMWATGNIQMVVADALGNLVFNAETVCPAVATGVLLAANNLSDVANASAARANLGLGTAAVQNIGTGGAALGLLDAAVTFSGANDHVGPETFAGGLLIDPPGGVLANINAGYLGIPVVPKTGNYTFTLPDRAFNYYFAGTCTATIPANASVAYNNGDFLVASWPSGATGTVAITSDTLRWPVGNLTGSRTVTGPGFLVALKMNTTEWWVTGGANIS